MGNRYGRLTAVAALMMTAGLACGQVFSSSPNAPILDLQTTIDQIQVSGVGSPISTMAVTLNLFHTWTADLDIVLVFNGQTLELSTDNGGSGDNMLGTRFIDSAAISIVAGVAPFTGDFRPEGTTPLWNGAPIPQVFLSSFAGFSGQDANGTWELFVYDDTGADIGTLVDWSIDFNPGAPPPPPPGPPGDACADAIVVGEGTHAFTNVGANTDYTAFCTPGYGDVFYSWTPSFTGTARVTTCGLTTLDTTLTALSECGGFELACNDDACGLQSRIQFAVTAGVPVIIRVASWSAATRGSGSFSIEEVVSVTNDLCANATPVSDGVYVFDTSGAGGEGPGACGASAGSPDVFFLWTPASDGCGTIETCGLAGYDTVLEVVSACGGVSVACNDDSCGLQSRLSLTNVTAGVPIIVRVSGYAGSSGTGQVSFLSQPSTPYSAPSGTDEGEPCIEAAGDTYNAGCNSTPPSYLPLSRCQTYIGTSWYNTSIGFRDTDWYEFTLAEAQTVTVTGQARFAAQLYFLEIIDCASGQIGLIASANNSACTPDFTMSASLPAGTWYVFVGPTFTSAVSCGSDGEDYWFTLSYGDECSGGGECDPDFNQDGNVDQDDIACLAQVVAGDPSCSGNDPDFNGDGNVDQDDVAALEQVVGGAPCP